MKQYKGMKKAIYDCMAILEKNENLDVVQALRKGAKILGNARGVEDEAKEGGDAIGDALGNTPGTDDSLGYALGITNALDHVEKDNNNAGNDAS
ncbi:unnamed protein product [Ilex paraguariensis]|uniref:Uncharacterized protein n=1 Tax=Ilex paraguariensis TaxID=185542 RepID=A0ABC8QKS1_9AQUA